MKKLFLIAHLNDLSGANRSLVDLASGLRQAFSVLVVVPRKGPLSEELERRGIPYKVILASSWVYKRDESMRKKIIKRILNGIAEISYYAFLKKERPALIHYNSYIFGCGAKAAQRLGIPYTWHIRELPEENFGLTFFNKTKSNEIISCAQRIVTISEFMKSKLADVFPLDKTCVVYNGIAPLRGEEPNMVFGALDRIALIGAIAPDKGQTDAIEALKYLRKQGVRKELFLVGPVTDQQYEQTLRSQITEDISEDVHFVGYQSDVSPYRTQDTLSLICSRAEAFGRVTIEAMKYGQIMIGADTGATPEIIRDGKNGFLYRQGDGTDLAQKILLACNAPDKSTIAREARRTVEESFCIERTILEMQALFETVTSHEEKQ